MSPPPPAASHDDALPPGTRLGEFEIVRVLGVGGFGIVYLARDHALERDVALKEYMPASLASRGVSGQITVRSSSLAETYAIGLKSFINEARMLARFDHPSLVKVYRFWEDKGTAYMVMPYLEGRSLREVRKSMEAPPNGRWLRGLLDPVLDAVDRLHREGVFHRDIAPDNIIITSSGLPVLLDFGAARRAISDRTQQFTAILKPSYAPIEQYADMNTMRQGPWTDLYAIGAVLHYMIFGVPPSPATARAVYDDLAGLAQREVPGISSRFMAALAWALAVRPQERPQDVSAFRAALDGRIAVPMGSPSEITLPGATALMPVTPAYEKTLRIESEAPPYEKTQRLERPVAPAIVPPPAPSPAAQAPAPLRESPARVAPPMPMPMPPREMPKVEPKRLAPAPAPRRSGLLLAGGAVVAGVVAASAWFAWRGKEPAPTAPPSPAASTVSAPAPPPEPMPAPPPLATRLVPAPAAVQANAAPVADGGSTIRQICDRRLPVAWLRCLERECRKPANRSDPDCVQHLEERRRRAEP
jgi:serine/threonine protein kinase